MTQQENSTAVRAVLMAWSEAIKRGDMDGVLANHTDEVVMFDVVPPFKIAGIAAYRTSWDLFFSYQPKGVFDFSELEIVAGDDVAFCHCLVTCGGTKTEDQFQVRLTVGLRKIQGQWLISHEHHSVPGDES